MNSNKRSDVDFLMLGYSVFIDVRVSNPALMGCILFPNTSNRLMSEKRMMETFISQGPLGDSFYKLALFG